MHRKIEKAIEKIKNVEGFKKVAFIILYGSAAEGQKPKNSDIDLCIYYDGDYDEASRFRFEVLSELFDDIFDVQIFQQLPMYVRINVLKGNIIYCKKISGFYTKQLLRREKTLRHLNTDFMIILEKRQLHEKRNYQNKDKRDKRKHRIDRQASTRHI